MLMDTTPKKVYLIRHGESEGNISNFYQPLDSPLSQKGKEQAEFIAKRVSHLPIDVIIASPLQRAKETADIVSRKLKIEVEFSELFVERKKPTGLSGQPHDDPEAKKLSDEWSESLFVSGTRAKDGENFDDIKDRAIQALDFLAKRPEKNILIVTHGFFMRTMAACVLFGAELTGEMFRLLDSKIRTKNTGLSIFKYNEEVKDLPWQLWVWNDHAHLAEP